ncbi:hypothetical protein CSOJ01_08837 [Colletotrichum sojae]|uniref:Uncharacterized protein n=1 Tax=Colletotrichum sojae TaxID=2175907 RepID=A0A8H6MRG4_9PEZI|nr:hypothetical protein CSOJ01_08837 [Colletotrichum sojae]
MAANAKMAPPAPPITTDPSTFATLSVSHILRLHHRERLVVHPLLWTSRQLDLLSCAFVDAPPTNTDQTGNGCDTDERHTSPPLIVGSATPSNAQPGLPGVGSKVPSKKLHDCHGQAPSVYIHARMLTLAKLLPAKAYAIRQLLCEDQSSCVEKLAFHYDKQAIRLPCIQMLFSIGKGSQFPDSPSIAHVYFLEIVAARKSRLGRLTRSLPSPPIRSLQKIRLQRVTPVSLARDSYIVAVLIAMAQAQAGRDSASPGTESFRVNLLLNNIDDKSHLHVFSAVIEKVLLERLANPKSAPPHAVQTKVHTHVVPYKPFLTFQQRLLEVIASRRHKRKRQPDDE